MIRPFSVAAPLRRLNAGRVLLCLSLAAVTFAALTFQAGSAQAAPDPLDGKKILELKFQGNKKTENEAIRQNLSLQKGDVFSREKLREDLKAVWNMSYFEDITVDAEERDGGIVLTWILVEKPTIHKILVAGAVEVGMDKINEVLDLRKETILDLAKVKRNVEKIRDLYVEKGFYLADVSYEIKHTDSTGKPLGPNDVDVQFNVAEHAKVEVRRISFIGNHAAKTEDLLSVMGTKEGGFLSFITSSGTYKEDAFDRDLLLLTAYYYDLGYINVKLGKPEQELSGDKEYLYLTIPIDEGPRYRIGKVDFSGDLVADKSEYYKRLTVHPGEVFNRTRLGQDIVKLNDLYKDKGYAYVNPTPLTNIDSDKKIVDLDFSIQKGVKVYFERINVRGNVKTRDKVIRRELKVYEGELYNQTLLDFSRKRVQALGYFEKVELSTRRGTADDKIEVNIEVTERPTGTFQIGAGFSSVENFIGQAQVAQNNLFGRGQTLTLQAQISSLRQLFSLRFLDPYFFDTLATFSFSIYNNLLFYPSFNRTARGGDMGWGYLLSDNVRVFGTYKLESVTVAPNQAGQIVGGGFGPAVAATPSTISNLFRSGITSSIRLSVNWDTRNDRLFPTKGVFMSAAVEEAGEETGSQSIFTRATGFARFYYPILGPLVFRTNIEVGYVGSYAKLGVPIYERYLMGGINTVRGFPLYSLGPKVSVLDTQDPNAFLKGINIGGNLQFISNFEIEIPIFPQMQIKGVVFFDAGNAYNTEEKWCPSNARNSALPSPVDPCALLHKDAGQAIGSFFSDLRTSVGFGVRWFSPLGPLRFEWGVPLARLAGEDPIVFEFTIGNFF